MLRERCVTVEAHEKLDEALGRRGLPGDRRDRAARIAALGGQVVGV